ncbi:MAG: glycerophosphodiester phosphodiesterase [Pseudonocardia sp.]|nr:glycerophosphodiester phosphodiesterase [Pseudonocardia sp.]
MAGFRAEPVIVDVRGRHDGRAGTIRPVHPYLAGPRPRAYAHRGWHTGALAGCENTLAAFRRAVEEGFGYLELDVHASADGVAVVHHDVMLGRTTDGTGRLSAHTVAQLEKVRVCGREPIPLLADVLAALPDTRVTIELKSAAVVPSTLAAVEATKAWDRVCVGGFEQAWVNAARRGGGDRLCTSMASRDVFALRARAWLEALPRPMAALPSLPLAGDVAHVPVTAGPIRVVDASLVRTAHAHGREVHVWTINAADRMRRLLDLGVDGLLSDRPDLLRDVLRERGQWPA